MLLKENWVFDKTIYHQGFLFPQGASAAQEGKHLATKRSEIFQPREATLSHFTRQS